MSQTHGDDHMRAKLSNDEEEDPIAWWNKDRSTPPPFKLVRKLTLSNGGDLSLHSLAIFPWDEHSLAKLWGGVLAVNDDIIRWKNEVIDELWDSVAIGSALDLYVCFTQRLSSPLSVRFKDKQQVLAADEMCVAWALAKENPFLPLVIISRGSLIYIYNILGKGIAGFIRGHGGTITSISVHPTTPHLFCTTSRDFTTRIYDLSLSANIEMIPKSDKKNDIYSGVPNPPWPPNEGPSLAGAAHALRLINIPNTTGHPRHPPIEREGGGRGRCVAVLQGGRSGGHNAAVLGSAFHPTHPLVATCGLDRVVKIWPVRPSSETVILREDKPWLTSPNIHKSRVLSISWLDSDLLLTHSAPAIMREAPDDIEDKRVYIEPGELTLWTWHGLDRFFPANQEPNTHGSRLCASDYHDSGSYKINSVHRFPVVPDQYTVPNLSLFQSQTHSPLISYVYPGSTSINLMPVEHMQPRERPAFHCEAEERLLGGPEVAIGPGATLADAAGRLRLVGSSEETEEKMEIIEEDDDEEALFEDDLDTGPIGVRREDIIPPNIDCRTISIEFAKVRLPEETLTNCAVGMNGELIVAVGTKGCVWIWRHVEPV